MNNEKELIRLRLEIKELKTQRLINQMFLGRITEELGLKKCLDIMNECRKAIGNN